MLCASLICLCLPAIMAAEERRKKREQMKILKQQVRSFLCVHCLIFRAKLHNYLQLPCWYSEFVLQGEKVLSTVELLLKFFKEVAILQNAAPHLHRPTVFLHPTPRSPPPLYNMHDLTVNSFDLALILLPGEDQAHSANSYGERTPCTANSRGSSWKLLQKHSKTLPFCCW